MSYPRKQALDEERRSRKFERSETPYTEFELYDLYRSFAKERYATQIELLSGFMGSELCREHAAQLIQKWKHTKPTNY